LTYLRGHRVADISYRRKRIACTCGQQMTAPGKPRRDDTNAALEAAWLAHRRAVGMEAKSIATALLTRA
jgi:hypothetical protein